MLSFTFTRERHVHLPLAPSLSPNFSQSDTICPWCFVGKRRLEKALQAVSAAHPGASFEVRWRPFQLNPALPFSGISKLQHYREKFGAARVAQMLPMMAKVGSAEGIAFSYEGLISNTLLSHALLGAAWAEGGAALQNRLCEGLFRHYFEQQGCLTDVQALTSICAAAGLSPTTTEQLLQGEGSSAASRAAQAAAEQEASEWAKRHKISGVPFILIDGKHALEGAQDPSTIQSVLEELLADS